jgi:TrmH family RNA methyltransferase
MLLDGEHLLQEALASAVQLDVVAVAELLATNDAVLRASKAGARIVILTDAVWSAISPVRTPSGIAAIAVRPATSLDQVFERQPALVVMLHDVQDPGNVGAIIRAAEGCGATGLICNEHTADPFGWKALRGAMGSSFRLPIAAKQSLAKTIAIARSAGLRIFATNARGGTPLPECDLRMPAAVILGGEGAGLPDELAEQADVRLTIPMQPPVESLNVAVAAALVSYEAARQRGTRLLIGHHPDVSL